MAACRLAIPPQEIPIIPTEPEHQSCEEIHSIISTASCCSRGKYSSSMIPSESPWPRKSGRIQAYPRAANQSWFRWSRIATASLLRYGIYSRIAGTGLLADCFGSQIFADNLTPSDISIHTCGITLKRPSKVAILLVGSVFVLNTFLSSLWAKIVKNPKYWKKLFRHYIF